MSILQDFLKQVLDFALTGTGDQGVVASAHLRLKLLLSVTQTLAPPSTSPSTPASATAPAAAGGTGTAGVAAAPVAGTASASPADPAAALAKLGSVVGSIGNQLA
jgi:hypothetical protein